jgi:hypothetical protein
MKKQLFMMAAVLGMMMSLVSCRFDTGFVSGVVSFKGVPCQQGQTDFQVPPCSGPYPNHKIEVYPASDPSKLVLTAMTDSRGAFKIELPVGEYIIYTQDGIKPEQRRENKFKIEKDKTIPLNLTINTGIL